MNDEKLIRDFEMTEAALEAAEAAARVPFSQDGPYYKPLNDAVIAKFREKQPRARNVTIESALKGLTDEERDEAIAPIRAQALEHYKQLQNEVDAIRERLYEIAGQMEIPRSRETRIAETFHVYQYSTQTNSHGYARGRAEVAAARARKYGLQATVITVNDGEYGLAVNTTELGVKILMWKRGLDFWEFIEACWNRALNPIVYWHTLPTYLNSRASYENWKLMQREGLIQK